MRKSIVMAVLVTLFSVHAAQAAGPITVNGADANGVRDPGGCVVQPEGTDMHVNCTSSPDSAFVRFRFLDDVGGVRAPATVSGLLRDQDQASCADRSLDGAGPHAARRGAPGLLRPHRLGDLEPTLT